MSNPRGRQKPKRWENAAYPDRGCTHRDIVRAVARDLGMPKRDVRKVTRAVMNEIIERLIDGRQTVDIESLGKFIPVTFPQTKLGDGTWVDKPFRLIRFEIAPSLRERVIRNVRRQHEQPKGGR